MEPIINALHRIVAEAGITLTQASQCFTGGYETSVCDVLWQRVISVVLGSTIPCFIRRIYYFYDGNNGIIFLILLTAARYRLLDSPKAF